MGPLNVMLASKHLAPTASPRVLYKLQVLYKDLDLVPAWPREGHGTQW